MIQHRLQDVPHVHLRGRGDVRPRRGHDVVPPTHLLHVAERSLRRGGHHVARPFRRARRGAQRHIRQPADALQRQVARRRVRGGAARADAGGAPAFGQGEQDGQEEHGARRAQRIGERARRRERDDTPRRHDASASGSDAVSSRGLERHLRGNRARSRDASMRRPRGPEREHQKRVEQQREPQRCPRPARSAFADEPVRRGRDANEPSHDTLEKVRRVHARRDRHRDGTRDHRGHEQDAPHAAHHARASQWRTSRFGVRCRTPPRRQLFFRSWKLEHATDSYSRFTFITFFCD